MNFFFEAPYYCAQGNMMTALTTCMNGLMGAINVNGMVNKVNAYKNSNLIDDPANLRNHRVYIYSGTMDFTVKSSKKQFQI
jgi:hypothetical protein